MDSTFGTASPAQVSTPSKEARTIVVPPGCVALAYIRSYSEPFKPRNGPYNRDMDGRFYITVSKESGCKHRHYRTTRVVSSVTSSMENGAVSVKSATWSSNPLDADTLAAGRASRAVQDRGYISHPDTETYDVLDDDGNLIEKLPVWEPCENPDPAPITISTSANMGV